MLVICNGAQKSGSTWLFNILSELVDFSRPPDVYLTDNSKKPTRNPCIRPDRLAQFFESEDVEGIDYISKNHMATAEYRDLVVGRENVYVFGIERDLRDVVVSAYYDKKNRDAYAGSFADYYWQSGRELADQIVRYHEVWRNCGAAVYQSSYERLKDSFQDEARRIAAVLGLDPSDDRLGEIETATGLGMLREKYSGDDLYQGDRFFRKGVVGDWENHFDDGISRDLETIQRSGISRLDHRALARRARSLLGRLRGS